MHSLKELAQSWMLGVIRRQRLNSDDRSYFVYFLNLIHHVRFTYCADMMHTLPHHVDFVRQTRRPYANTGFLELICSGVIHQCTVYSAQDVSLFLKKEAPIRAYTCHNISMSNHIICMP